MTQPVFNWSERSICGFAGLLYVAVILLGLGSEIGLRLPVLSAADPSQALAAAAHILPLSLLADSLMIAADVALAALLFALLAPVDRGLSLLAALFRLIQAAVLAGNLIHLQDAMLRLSDANGTDALRAMQLHAAGYDLGLIFFGISSILTGYLLTRHPAFPRWLGALIILTGLVYLTGTGLRIAAPDAFAAFQPAYLVAIIGETAFAATLLRLGFGPRRTAITQ